MTTSTIRERVLEAFLARLKAVEVEGLQVERNRDIPVETYPFLVMIDGGQIPDIEQPGVKAFEMQVDVELYVSANRPELLAAAFDELYGQAIKACLVDRTLGDLAVDVTEGQLEDPIIDRNEGTGPTMAASLAFSIDYWVAVDDPYTLAA